MGQRADRTRLPADKIVCIRRGLDRLPAVKPLRATRSPLHRLRRAPRRKERPLHQLRIYAP
jgi:colanic acid/amylovoran biosynthesis glycosyltransferase